VKNWLHVFASRNQSYPVRIEALTQIGIRIPSIVRDLVIEPRNILEHTYELPSKRQAQHALDVADLMLRATDSEDSRGIIVALNWRVLGSYSCSDKGAVVDF